MVLSSSNVEAVPDASSADEIAALMSQVDQTGSTAGGDIVGGDKTTLNYHPAPLKPGIIEQLMLKLSDEMKTSQEIRHTIESLQFYYLNKSKDGINGLDGVTGPAASGSGP